MSFFANHSIIVGKRDATKTIAAGELVTDLPTDEIKRLLTIGAIGSRAHADPSAEPVEGAKPEYFFAQEPDASKEPRRS